MRKLIAYTLFILTACVSKKISKNETLSCVLLGYDSMAYYYGNSSNMDGLEFGSLNNSEFTTGLTDFAKKRNKLTGFKISIKPTASANVGSDFTLLVELLNVNGLGKISTDSLDENEKAKFNATSLLEIVKNFKSTIAMPKDDSSVRPSVSAFGTNTLTIIIFKDTGLYIYKGADIKNGKYYMYYQLNKFLSQEKSKGLFSVIIKPASSNTYKNTVNILDEMTKNNISDYKLVDISSDEQALLQKNE